MKDKLKSVYRRLPIAIYILMIGAIVFILAFSGQLKDISSQLLLDAVFGVGSLTLALATVMIYFRQNDIIQEQTKATIQDRKALIQTLDMATTDSGYDLLVELSNSGGGAARELCGYVKFDVPKAYDINPEPYSRQVERQSVTRDHSGDRTWLASEGNTIAADENQIPVKIQCAVEFPEQEHAFAFRTAVDKFADYWRKEQLSQLQSALSADQLETIGTKWEAEVFFDMADGAATVAPDEIAIDELNRIATTVSEFDARFDGAELIDTELRLRIWIEYIDEYLENIGHDATFDVDVLDATFDIQHGMQFNDVFDDDKRTSSRNIDPEGSALRA